MAWRQISEKPLPEAMVDHIIEVYMHNFASMIY